MSQHSFAEFDFRFFFSNVRDATGDEISDGVFGDELVRRGRLERLHAEAYAPSLVVEFGHLGFDDLPGG